MALIKCKECGKEFSVRTSYFLLQKKSGVATQFSSRACVGKSQRTRLDSEFFEKNSIPVPHSGCWIWSGPIWDSNGYGRISRSKSQGGDVGAHRASFLAHKGEIPENLVVRHSCDTPLCVNPDHLSLGTPSDNKHDSVIRKRHTHGRTMWNATLTESQIPEIRRMLALGISQSEVARRFGVSHGVIYRIDHKVTWRHVT